MYRKTIIALVFLMILPAISHAKRTKYLFNNNRFDFIKLEEVKSKEADKRGANHPYNLSLNAVKKALSSIKLHKSFLISKKIEEQKLYDDRDVDMLAPHIVQAFSESTVYDEVVFSNLTKNPNFVFRNDRLTMASMWIVENELHMKFQKLYAKLDGDYTNRGSMQRVANRAKGLRVKFDLEEGQSMDSSDELILDLNYFESGKNKGAVVEEDDGDESGDNDGETDVAKKRKTPKKKSKSKGSKYSKKEPVELSASSSQPAIKERLKTLGDLKKEGLINEEEYQAKRKSILDEI
ncbi:SHOCT domain-containing protein [bacterium]|nr:SHOCT domain-containing protein [bacterium]